MRINSTAPTCIRYNLMTLRGLDTWELGKKTTKETASSWTADLLLLWKFMIRHSASKVPEKSTGHFYFFTRLYTNPSLITFVKAGYCIFNTDMLSSETHVILLYKNLPLPLFFEHQFTA